jgi:glycosyltransferase involved in cell wall biosynthesis
MNITFLITACNEIDELKLNLTLVNIFREKKDEILVLLDEKNCSEEIKKIAELNSDRVIFKELNGDFSSFKNFGILESKYNYILHLDADELINAFIINQIRGLIVNDPSISGVHVPRINIITNASKEDLDALNFKVNENNWINWPDYQPRFINKNSGIKFINKVHETFSNFSQTKFLQAHPVNALLHVKSLEKQKKQNKYYDSI